MPRKIRQLKADLRRAGFRMRQGRGDHTVWEHPQVPAARAVLDGQDGDDAKRYQEKDVREALVTMARALAGQEERS